MYSSRSPICNNWIRMSADGNSRMGTSEGGDVRPHSNHSTSRKRIKILPPKLDGNSRTVASEGGDIRAPSEHSTSTKRTKLIRGFGKGPRFPLLLNFNGLCVKEDFSKFVGIALSSFNEANRAQEAPLYQLVEVLGGILTPVVCTYHFNFIAGPKNGTEAENMLFFAEVKIGRYEGGAGPYCRCCCILGAPGSETGNGDCHLYCHNHPGHVQHPEGGFTNKISFK